MGTFPENTFVLEPKKTKNKSSLLAFEGLLCRKESRDSQMYLLFQDQNMQVEHPYIIKVLKLLIIITFKKS
jgi:hypothetical protein